MSCTSLNFRTVNPFIDVEAEVDKDGSEEEDEEEELEDPFIDDVPELNAEHCPIPRIFHRNADENEDALNRFLERLLAKAQPLSVCRNPTAHLPVRQALPFLPSEDDYPMFRLACRMGTEEIVVSSLFNMANKCHDLRAAFTRGSLRGNVYLECRMTHALIQLLEITPGIIRTQKGLRYELVPSSEHLDLLSMQNFRGNIITGKWIRASKGLYRGDVGLIVGTHSWGSTVLHVPRIPPPPTGNTLKRKSSTLKPPSRLFDAQRYPQATLNSDGSYTLGRLSFERGLVVKQYDYHSVSADVQDIPIATFLSFAACGHPDVAVSSLPRPQEWSFQRDDRVMIRSSWELGLFQAVQTDYAEVEIEGEIRRVPWNDIVKNVAVGSFVKINTGAFNGKSGWVVEITAHVASIMESLEPRDANPAMDVGLNELIISTPPHQYAMPRDPVPTISIPKSQRHAWNGMNVTVIKHKMHKGKPAVVKEVLLGQATGSSIKLDLQLMSYDPAAPYQRILVDSDDVVNTQTGTKLSGDAPRTGLQEPRRPAVRELPTGCATPMPMSSSETPAWNPSSATPSWAPSPSSIWDSPSQTLAQEPSQLSTSRIGEPASPHPQHVLLNPRLAGSTLTVKVNGGNYSNKEVEATICGPTGGVAIRTVKYNVSTLLQPEWVTPKHPSPTHDNGLLIIIKGDHCGKHARRIYHRRENNITSIILAIVTRKEGSLDVLTGEQLELTSDYLCTVKESKMKKEHLELMKPLRAEYH